MIHKLTECFVSDHIDEGGGLYGGGIGASGEAGHLYDDEEVRQYHQEIQNHYAQQNMMSHLGHQSLAQQNLGHQAFGQTVTPTSDVHSTASSSGIS